MNTVTVKTNTGINFDFKSGANNFIDNVIRAVERLERDHDFKTEVMAMGTDFTIGVY